MVPDELRTLLYRFVNSCGVRTLAYLKQLAGRFSASTAYLRHEMNLAVLANLIQDTARPDLTID